jgi:hypothetical protein
MGMNREAFRTQWLQLLQSVQLGNARRLWHPGLIMDPTAIAARASGDDRFGRHQDTENRTRVFAIDQRHSSQKCTRCVADFGKPLVSLGRAMSHHVNYLR